ncbi:protein FAM162B [Aulostomus maculatus]
MNFITSRFSIRNILGQRCRHVSETWSYRRMCNKPQEVKADPPPAVPPPASQRLGFKIPGTRPSKLDKKALVWSGRFKSTDEIPELVSFEMVEAARNKLRVKICFVMMAATIGACFLMIFLGRQAAHDQQSLTNLNMEKRAKWREELQKEREASLALSGKAQ